MDLTNLLPGNFLHVLGGGTLLLALLALIYSLFDDRRRDAGVKASGILLSITLAALANNSWVYGVTVFIIAALFTDREFLLNLAAIFRGSKEFFEYKSKEAVKEKAETKILAQEAFVAQKQVFTVADRAALVQEYLDVEEKVFSHLEKEFRAPILRHVTLRGKKRLFDFDGLMKTQDLDVLLEVKYIKSRDNIVSTISATLPRLVNSAVAYRKMISREVMLRINIVSPIEIEEWKTISDKLYSLVQTTEIQVLFVCIHPRVLD